MLLIDNPLITVNKYWIMNFYLGGEGFHSVFSIVDSIKILVHDYVNEECMNSDPGFRRNPLARSRFTGFHTRHSFKVRRVIVGKDVGTISYLWPQSLAPPFTWKFWNEGGVQTSLPS